MKIEDKRERNKLAARAYRARKQETLAYGGFDCHGLFLNGVKAAERERKQAYRQDIRDLGLALLTKEQQVKATAAVKRCNDKFEDETLKMLRRESIRIGGGRGSVFKSPGTKLVHDNMGTEAYHEGHERYQVQWGDGLTKPNSWVNRSHVSKVLIEDYHARYYISMTLPVPSPPPQPLKSFFERPGTKLVRRRSYFFDSYHCGRVFYKVEWGDGEQLLWHLFDPYWSELLPNGRVATWVQESDLYINKALMQGRLWKGMSEAKEDLQGNQLLEADMDEIQVKQ